MGGDSGVECRGLCGRARQKMSGTRLVQESMVEDALRKLRMEFCSAF